MELVEHCAQVEGIQRIRLGSLDPDMLTPEFITRLAAVEKLCPQFHLSLQSGCTATLRRMRRVYTAEPVSYTHLASLIWSIIALVLPEPLVPTISLIIVQSSCIFHALRREIIFIYFSFASSSAVRPS